MRSWPWVHDCVLWDNSCQHCWHLTHTPMSRVNVPLASLKLSPLAYSPSCIHVHPHSRLCNSLTVCWDVKPCSNNQRAKTTFTDKAGQNLNGHATQMTALLAELNSTSNGASDSALLLTLRALQITIILLFSFRLLPPLLDLLLLYPPT